MRRGLLEKIDISNIISGKTHRIQQCLCVLSSQLSKQAPNHGILKRQFNSIQRQARDILSYTKKQASQIKTLLEENKDPNHRAQSASTKYSQAMLDLVHDLRAPLMGFSGNAELMLELLKAPLSQLSKQECNVDILQSSLEKLNELTEAIILSIKDQKSIFNELNENQSSSYSLTLKETQFSINKLVNDTVKSFQASFKVAGITLSKKVPNKEYWITADGNKIKRMLGNFLTNAKKFTAQKFSAENKNKDNKAVNLSLTINSKPHSSEDVLELKFEISDTGIGLTENQLVSIFEHGKQAEGVKQEFGGSGIGLTNCKNFLDACDGEIKVSSPGLGQGTTFKVTLSCAKAPQAMISVHLRRTRRKRKYSQTRQKELLGPRLLIVDDEVINQKLLQRMMENLGYPVPTLVSNGQDAITEYVTNHEEYDLILMDINMPEMSGLEVTRKIRTVEKERKLIETPIIALSGNTLERQKKAALATGMTEYLTKPVTLLQLKQTIEKYCQQTSQQRKVRFTANKAQATAKTPSPKRRRLNPLDPGIEIKPGKTNITQQEETTPILTTRTQKSSHRSRSQLFKLVTSSEATTKKCKNRTIKQPALRV